MNKVACMTTIGALIVSASCFGRVFIVKNELKVPIYCDLDARVNSPGCNFNFDTNFPGQPKESIPAGAEVVNGTGRGCHSACYYNVKIRMVHSPYHFHIDLDDDLNCNDLGFRVYEQGDYIVVAIQKLYNPEQKSIDLEGEFKVYKTLKSDFYRKNATAEKKNPATVSKIVNNSGAKIIMNSSSQKNGYGKDKFDLIIPANRQGTVSELSGKTMDSITVPDETVGAGAIEFFIKRNNKDNRIRDL